MRWTRADQVEAARRAIFVVQSKYERLPLMPPRAKKPERPPSLLLEFTGGGGSTHPAYVASSRPVDVAEILTSIEAVYMVTALNVPPPSPEEGELEWVQRNQVFSRRLGLKTIRMESPLQVLLEIPPSVVVLGATAFPFYLVYVFGAPYRAGARFNKARARYFESRLEADEAREAWLERKAERSQRGLLRLSNLWPAGWPYPLTRDQPADEQTPFETMETPPETIGEPEGVTEDEPSESTEDS